MFRNVGQICFINLLRISDVSSMCFPFNPPGELCCSHPGLDEQNKNTGYPWIPMDTRCKSDCNALGFP